MNAVETKNYMPHETLCQIDRLLAATFKKIEADIKSHDKILMDNCHDASETGLKMMHAEIEKIKYLQGYKSATAAMLSYINNSFTTTH